MNLDFLTQFKDFLSDRPEWAFLALTLTALYWAVRGWMKEKDSRLDDAKKLLPVVLQLKKLFESATAKVRRRRNHSPDSQPDGEQR